jgi:hypothetical protein
VIYLVDDVMRVLSAVVFLWVFLRWSTSTRWWHWWDTRALFVLFASIAIVTGWSVLAAAGAIPEWLKPWVAAFTWSLVGGSGVFLAIGYEREQWRARQKRRVPAQHEDQHD